MAYKIYRIRDGILVESVQGIFHIKNTDWDSFINDDALFSKLHALAQTATFEAPVLASAEWLKPVNKYADFSRNVYSLGNKPFRKPCI